MKTRAEGSKFKLDKVKFLQWSKENRPTIELNLTM